MTARPRRPRLVVKEYLIMNDPSKSVPDANGTTPEGLKSATKMLSFGAGVAGGAAILGATAATLGLVGSGAVPLFGIGGLAIGVAAAALNGKQAEKLVYRVIGDLKTDFDGEMEIEVAGYGKKKGHFQHYKNVSAGSEWICLEYDGLKHPFESRVSAVGWHSPEEAARRLLELNGKID